MIEWKHFDKEGKTCERCSGTGSNLLRVMSEMEKELGIEISFKETKLPEEKMSESNEIIIDGILLENLIPDINSGENKCPSCSELIDQPESCNCRTLRQGEKVFEEIPVELIEQAILSRINKSLSFCPAKVNPNEKWFGFSREEIEWYPKIDQNKCIQCLSCLNFCKNRVYEEINNKVMVANPYNCIVGCTGCDKVCPQKAITHPPKEYLNKLKNMNNKIEKIEVFGSGCGSCKKLFDLTKRAVIEIGLDAEVEYIDDIQRVMELGVMSFPVLAINGKPIIIGMIPDIEEIKKIIISYQEGMAEAKEGSSGCSCGGNC